MANPTLSHFHHHLTGELLPMPDHHPLPCPFCDQQTGGVDHSDADSVVYQVICDACGASGPPAFSSTEAAYAWNRRQ